MNSLRNQAINPQIWTLEHESVGIITVQPEPKYKICKTLSVQLMLISTSARSPSFARILAIYCSLSSNASQ